MLDTISLFMQVSPVMVLSLSYHDYVIPQDEYFNFDEVGK